MTEGERAVVVGEVLGRRSSVGRRGERVGGNLDLRAEW